MYYSDKAISKFHSCNAHIEHYMDMEMFVSYTTPIAIISYDTTHCAHLYVSSAFNCSATTRKQFSRWLREHGLNYYDVKDAPRDKTPHRAIQGPCGIRCGFTPSELERIFNNKQPLT